MSRLQDLFSELRRRHVFKVGAAYCVVAWLVVEIGTTIFNILALPTWSPRLLLALAILGFPLALVLAWAYEVTPEGARRTRTDADVPPPPARPRKSLSAFSSGLLPFLGREREMERLTSLLADPDIRLISVVGPGGIGKTRLALALAERQQAHFRDGVIYLPLDGVSSADHFLSELADSLELGYGPGPLRQRLLDLLRGREHLLVLDGFEGLLESSDLIPELLRASPSTRLLVTSRERLELQGECSLSLEGLEIPADADAVGRSAAAQLFVHAARRRQPSFVLTPDQGEPLLRICDRLGGMPLGLELAAGWVDLLSVHDIAREIEQSLDFLESRGRDIPARHRSIRAVIESAWARLSTGEREALAALTVFRGGFSLQAAREVAGATPEVLAELMSKSLVHRPSENRLHLHRLLRAAAGERLRPAGEALLRERHAHYFSNLVATTAPALGTAGQPAALDRLQEEFENIAEAWRWSVANGRWSVVEQMLEGVHYFCDLRSRIQEADALLGPAAAALRERPGAAPHDTDEQGILLGRLLARQGYFSWRQGQTGPAVRLYSEAIERLAPTPARRDHAFALNGMGEVSVALGRYADANRLCGRALAIFREFDDKRGMAASLNNLGVVAHHLRDYRAAREYHRESLQVSRELGDQYAVAFSLNNLGVIAHDLQELTEAERLYAESLSIAEALGDRHGIAAALVNLGRVAQAHRNAPRAREYAERAACVYRELGDRLGAVACAINLGDSEISEGNLERAEVHLLGALKEAVSLGFKPLVGEAVVALAAVAARSGREREALRWLTAVRDCSELDLEAQSRRDVLLASLTERLAEPSETPGVPSSPPPLERVASEILTHISGGPNGQGTAMQAHRSR